MAPTDIAAFATTQLDLLDRELKAELEETSELSSQYAPAGLQRAGLAVLNLQLGSQRTGFGGKTIVDLEHDSAIGQADLPEHGFRPGDIVGVRPQVGGSVKKREKAEADKKGVDGVVVKTTSSSVAVALDKDEVDIPSGKLWIIKLANEATHKRMVQTVTRLQRNTDSQTSNFVRVLFGQSAPSPVPRDETALSEAAGKPVWVNESLNDSQKAAIEFALASQDIALIHGPPGTGKTQTLIELIIQLLRPEQQKPNQKPVKLLVCGPSNISVDNIVERLSPYKIPMVRLGHPARLLPSVLNHSLDILTKTSEAAAIVHDVRKEMDAKQASISKMRSGRERKAIYGDMRELRKEFRDRERQCVDELVRRSRVVLATLHGAGGHQLKSAEFDVVIIDEASQALEAQCWIPLLSAKKAVLAGDHLQLPPTIKSLNSKSTSKLRKDDRSRAEDAGNTPSMTLETTLFDRLLKLHGDDIKRMLTTQYRMHESIMDFPSSSLYNGELKAAEAVKSHLLKDLKYGVTQTDDTTMPLVFYDTQGGDFPEKAEDEEIGNRKKKSLTAESKSNENEAALVRRHVRALIDAGVCAEDIAVVTPYNAQLSILSTMLKDTYPALELGSVDGFQGREKEAVVLSLVRSNSEHEVGFLGEKRRLNVAMTRPRRHLCVVGDSETVGRGSTFLKSWMQHLEEHADLRYPDPSELND